MHLQGDLIRTYGIGVNAREDFFPAISALRRQFKASKGIIPPLEILGLPGAVNISSRKTRKFLPLPYLCISLIAFRV